MLVIEEKQQVASINVVTPTEFEAIYVAGVEPTSIFTSSICKLIFMFTKEFEAIDVYKRTIFCKLIFLINLHRRCMRFAPSLSFIRVASKSKLKQTHTKFYQPRLNLKKLT